MIDPIRSFYPVVRFDSASFPLDQEYKTEHTRVAPAQLYKLIIDSVVAAADKFRYENPQFIDSIPNIEFSFQSHEFESYLPTLLTQYSPNDINICIGTVCTVDEFLRLHKSLEEIRKEQVLLGHKHTGKISVFAPGINEQILEMIYGGVFMQNCLIEYIPGVFDRSDYELLIDIMGKLKFFRDLKVKIFPSTAENAEDLFTFSQGPFQELRQAKYKSRVFYVNNHLSDQQSNITDDSFNVITIKSPRNYMQIRERFLKDDDLRLFIGNPSHCEPHGISLIRDLSENHQMQSLKNSDLSIPKLTIIATGIKNSNDQNVIAKLFDAGATAVGTTVFKSALQEILSGACSSVEAQALMSDEVYKFYALVSTLLQEV